MSNPSGHTPNGYGLGLATPTGPLTVTATVWLTWTLVSGGDVAPGDVLDLSVDWGDGQTDSMTLVGSPWSPNYPTDLEHDYAAPGTYSITVAGSAGATRPSSVAYVAGLVASDPFASMADSPLLPFSNGADVTPNDTSDLPTVAEGVFVSGVQATVVTVGGSTIALPANPSIWPVRVRRVMASGTTGSVKAFW